MVDGRCYNAAFILRCSTKAGESVVIHGLEIAFRFVDQIFLVVLHQKISNQIAVQIPALLIQPSLGIQNRRGICALASDRKARRAQIGFFRIVPLGNADKQRNLFSLLPCCCSSAPMIFSMAISLLWAVASCCGKSMSFARSSSDIPGRFSKSKSKMM